MGTGLAISAQCGYNVRASGQYRSCLAIKAFKYHRNVFPIPRVWQTYRTQNPVCLPLTEVTQIGQATSQVIPASPASSNSPCNSTNRSRSLDQSPFRSPLSAGLPVWKNRISDFVRLTGLSATTDCADRGIGGNRALTQLICDR